MSRECFTPNEVARMLGVDWRKVISWICSGQLPAINTGTKRPRYKSFREDIEALKRNLAVRKPESKPVGQKRGKQESFPRLTDMKDVG